jgi:uncharacterized protein
MALHEFVFRSRLPVSAERLFEWHENPGAFDRLSPPWQSIIPVRFEGIRDGRQAEFILKSGPLRTRWIAEHRDYEANRQFRDVQIRGPFHAWSHLHRMIPDGTDQSVLEDRITYSLPLDPLAFPLAGRFAEKTLQRLFRYRHWITRHDLDLHARFGKKRLRVAISGSGGLIGRALRSFLTTGGHEVIPLVRSGSLVDENSARWDPETGVFESDRLEGVDAVIHLAAENVLALRWSRAKMARIRDSRVTWTRLLAEGLSRLRVPPRVLILASGVGYYGHRGETEVSEEAPPGSGFLAEVARDWEAAARPAEEAGVRVVHARIGAVLTPRGGIMRLLLPWFRAGLGAGLIGADPYVSWISMDDLLGAFALLLVDERMAGPVNVVTPRAQRYSQLARGIARQVGLPLVVRIPTPLLRVACGEAGRELYLTSTRARPTRLEEAGFTFALPDLDDALRHMLGRA